MTEPNQLESLRTRVKLLEAQIRSLGHEPIGTPVDPAADSLADNQDRLKLDEYIRYGRQMILPGFGLPYWNFHSGQTREAQLSLRNSSILVLGVGGLGCPALMYLAAAGVGKITIVDHDLVEVSNLHRQVLHGVDTVGRPKVESAKQALLRINPSVHIVTHHISLTSATLPIVFTPNVHFHAVLDCTDTPSTRYLLSDVTARLGVPLISGGAQRTDGQLIIYNLPPISPASTVSNNANTNATNPVNSAGPCMRCIFPSISRTGAGAERCSDVGVLGPVVGVIGVLMALETIKILTGFGADESQLYKPSMLLFTGLSPQPFRNIKLRLRQPKCPGCSMRTLHNSPQNLLVSQFIDDSASLQDNYEQFCDIGGFHTHDDPVVTGAREGESGARVRASVLKEALVSAAANPTLSIRIIDTRPPTEFGICSIPGSMNVPLPLLLKTPESYVSVSTPTFVVCRLGNDSQVAARALRSIIQAKEGDSQALDEKPKSTLPASPRQVVDIIGGLRAWAQEVDQSFPIY